MQRRLTRKGPSYLNPWRRGKLAINSESAEALSQQDDTKIIQKTLVPACEHTDGSGDEGYVFLSSDSNGPTTTSQEHWDMMPEKLRKEKRRVESAERPIEQDGRRKKISKRAENFTTPEAINMLIRGYQPTVLLLCALCSTTTQSICIITHGATLSQNKSDNKINRNCSRHQTNCF